MTIHGTQQRVDTGQPYHANVVPGKDGGELSTHDRDVGERLDETNAKLDLIAKLLLNLAIVLNADVESESLEYALGGGGAAGSDN